MIVAKFGGSSLADAGQIEKVLSIVRGDSKRRFIVPSAPGKRFDGDDKITDLLLSCHEKAFAGEDFSAPLSAIRARFQDIMQGLSLDAGPVLHEIDLLQTALLSGATRDFVASRGEYLCAIMLAQALGFPFVDAKDVIRFRRDGTLDAKETNRLLHNTLSPLDAAVIPGFYGADEDGVIHVFSRGGSDVSGALVARGINADLYENWTDVCGFRSADPRIVPDATFIQDMTYRELRELSYMGASVLHEDAVFPVRSAGIPTRVRNTNDPLHPGTMIHGSPLLSAQGPIVTGIAGRSGFSTIMLEKDRMNAEIGFGRKVLGVFEDCGLSFEHLPTGIDAMCVILPTAALEPKKQEVLDRITAAVSPDRLVVQNQLAMLAIVGYGMSKRFGIAARLFTAIAEQGISVKTMLMAPSELSVLIGIHEDDLNKAIATLYDAFIRT